MGTAYTEVLEGGGAQCGWGTERRPMWVKCRELGEHEQNAAGEMDRVRLLRLWAMFRFWTSSWNQWETAGGLKAGEWWSYVLVEWSKSDVESQVRDKGSGSGELVLGAPVYPGESWEVMMGRKSRSKSYLKSRPRFGWAMRCVCS